MHVKDADGRNLTEFTLQPKDTYYLHQKETLIAPLSSEHSNL